MFMLLIRAGAASVSPADTQYPTPGQQDRAENHTPDADDETSGERDGFGDEWREIIEEFTKD